MSDEFVRTCPNPKGNPRCKGKLTYSCVRYMEEAEQRGSVCKSCVNFGRKQTDEHKTNQRLSQIGKIISTETRKKISDSIKGHPYYGPGPGYRHTDEAKAKMSRKLRGQRRSAETRKKMSEAKIGHRDSDETRKKKSLATSGENNPMYGRPSPCGSPTSMSGRHKGLYFRSSCELLFLLMHDDVEWETAETDDFKIEYIGADGKLHNYFPDFFGDGFLVEVKPLGWKPDYYFTDAPFKIRAGAAFCENHGFEYLVAEMPRMEKTKIFQMRNKGELSLDKRWEKQYQQWLAAIEGT